MASAVRVADGTYDFSGGVDSASIRTVRSNACPNGLDRNQLAWLTNGTVRGGTIEPRTGWVPLINSITAPALYQGGFMYEPQFANPYLVLSIAGQIYMVALDPPYTVTNLSKEFGLTNPAAITQGFFEQGEQFLVIQAGDIFNNKTPTLPLFWDGNLLRRSHGITGNITGPNINELPAAGPMVYYGGRLWYAQGRGFTAGDIVDNQSSGNLNPYNFDDSILKVTENPVAIGGDSFRLPARAGNITALFFSQALDNNFFGQGPLFVGTRKQIYQAIIPVSRASWIATTNNTGLQINLAQLRWGPTSDRAIVHFNSDVFFTSLEPAIRSLFLYQRSFQQWSNTSLSRNEDRILAFNNRALMQFETGINFDNRVLMAIQPVQTPVGVAFQAIAPLDFDIISQIEKELPPAWEGIYEGLDFLQLFEGDFGGLQRAFGVVHSRVDGSLQVWELTDSDLFDGGDKRVVWSFETPCWTFQKEFEMKKLDSGELWIDSIFGDVQMTVEYRVDADPCWQLWFETQFCSARNPCELLPATNPTIATPTQCGTGYPLPSFCEGYAFPITFPEPQQGANTMMKRPTTIGYQFQIRITLKGWCRIVAAMIFGIPRERQPFEDLNGNGS